MANGYSYPAPDAVVLPNLFQAPGDAMQNAIAIKEHRADRDAEQAKTKQGYGAANLKNLKDRQEQINLPLGNDYANSVASTKAKELYDHLIEQVSSLPPVQFDYLLNKEVGNFLDWEKNFRTDVDFAKKYTDELAKNDPNLNTNLLSQTAQSYLEDKHFTKDASGNFIRKHPDEISNDQTFLSPLSDPKMKGILANEGASIIRQNVQSSKLHPEDFSQYSSNKGFVNSNSYDIGRSDLRKLSNDEQGNPILEPNVETFTLGNDISLKMIPENLFDDYMKRPSFESAFNKEWNPKALAIENKARSEGVSIDPTTEKMLQRDFLRDMIEKGGMDMSFINKKEKQVVPKPPHVSVNVSNGGNVSTYPVYGEVDAALADMESKGVKWQPIETLKPIPKNVILEQANKHQTNDQPFTPSTADSDGIPDGKYKLSDLKIIRGDDGTLRVFNVNGDFVDYVPQTDADVLGAKGQPERQKVLKNQTQPKPKSNRIKIDY